MRCNYCGRKLDSGVHCIDKTIWSFQAKRVLFTPAEQSDHPLASGSFCSPECLIRWIQRFWVEWTSPTNQESQASPEEKK